MKHLLALLALFAFPAMADTLTITCPETITTTTTAAGTTYTCPVAKAPTPTPPVATVCVPTTPNVKVYPGLITSQPAFPVLKPGEIGVFPLASALQTAGYVSVIQAGGTSQGTDVELWFSRCPGDLADPLRNQTQTNQYGVTKKPCVANYNYTGGPIYWNTKSGAVTICNLPAGVPYYVNFRHAKISGGANSCNQASCPNVAQMNVTAP